MITDSFDNITKPMVSIEKFYGEKKGMFRNLK